jgi:AcrR family transcriptional regulator
MVTPPLDATTPDRRRRRPRQERSRAMVERIVDAGRQVLLEHGYEAASTNRVAAAAGISPGSLYQYFPDKHALLAEVLERYTDELETRVSDAFMRAIGRGGGAGGDLGRDMAATTRQVVVAMLDTFAEHPGLLRILVEQAPRSDGSRRYAFARRIDQIVLGVLVTRFGPDHPRPVDAMAWLLVRTIEQATITWVLEAPAIDRDTLVDEITVLVQGYLDAPAPDQGIP